MDCHDTHIFIFCNIPTVDVKVCVNSEWDVKSMDNTEYIIKDAHALEELVKKIKHKYQNAFLYMNGIELK